MADEKQFYKPLLKWINSRFNYFIGGEYYRNGKIVSFTDIGPTGKIRLDVIGVKNIGPGASSADDVELIGIEVKDDKKIRYQDLAQTAGYKIFVHKAYLATTSVIDDEDRYWAQILGIGLIQINPDGKLSGKTPLFKIDIEATHSHPNHSEMLRLLDRLLIGNCMLCNNYFFLWDTIGDEKYKTSVLITRTKQINLMNKGIEDHILLFEKQQDVEKSEKIFRYICRSCGQLFGLIDKD